MPTNNSWEYQQSLRWVVPIIHSLHIAAVSAHLNATDPKTTQSADGIHLTTLGTTRNRFIVQIGQPVWSEVGPCVAWTHLGTVGRLDPGRSPPFNPKLTMQQTPRRQLLNGSRCQDLRQTIHPGYLSEFATGVSGSCCSNCR